MQLPPLTGIVCRQRQHPEPGTWNEAPRSGFTLAELLVVIAVIFLIAGLLLPVLARARERARRATCLVQLQQIVRAHQLYLQDWDERFPNWQMPAPSRPQRFSDLWFWTEYFQPYLRGDAIFHDPGAVRKTAPDAAWLADYALLTWGPGGYGRWDAPYFRWPGPPLTLADVVRPAETLTLVDGLTATSWTGRALRHDGGANAGFVDGHARWLFDREFLRVDSNSHGLYWLHYASADR